MRLRGHAFRYWRERADLYDEPAYRFGACVCGEWEWEWDGTTYPGQGIRDAGRLAYQRHLLFVTLATASDS